MTKTIKLGNLIIEMTPEIRKRIEKALNETLETLSRELDYSLDLQNTERISELQKHVAQLKDDLS